MSDFSIVFAGTPAFAAGHLAALLQNDLHVSAVYTQPDRAAGRGKRLQPSAVKALATMHQLPVYQPLNFKSPEAIADLAALKPDLLIVVAYGLLLPQAVLDIPRLGCINVHASLLPRWRGAAPIERAIEAGDSETGITIMQMDIGLDTGDMLLTKSLPRRSDHTGDNLRAELQTLGCDALTETLAQIQAGSIQPQKQDNNLATYAAKLNKTEAAIDWHLPAEQLARKIRAFNSSNVCYSQYQGQRIKIWQAQAEPGKNTTPGQITTIDKSGIIVGCGEGLLQLQELQLPNARKMAVADILNGRAGFFTQGGVFE